MHYTNSALNDTLAIITRELNKGLYTCLHYTNTSVCPYTYLLFDTVNKKLYFGCREKPQKNWREELLKRGGYWTRGSGRKAFITRPHTIDIIKVLQFCNHTDARRFEAVCLKAIGECQSRKDYFYNLQFGGGGSQVGVLGTNHPMFGKHLSSEAVEKISKANTGKRNPQYKYEGLVELFGDTPSSKLLGKDWATYKYLLRYIKMGRTLSEAIQERIDSRLPFEDDTKKRCLEYLNECRLRRVSGSFTDYLETEIKE